MAIPTRTDGTSYTRLPLGRRPIVLARLPHVGGSSLAAPPEPTATVAEQVALPASGASHFVDHRHAATRQAPQSESNEPREHSRRRRRRSSESAERQTEATFASPNQPAGLGLSLFQIHAQIAPYASAIVAAALLACAGLLYWMILSPSRPPGDYPSIGQEGLGLNSVELPKFTPSRRPSLNRETTSDNLPWWESDQAAVEMPQPEIQLPEETTASEPTPPLAEQPAPIQPEQTGAATDDPIYPTTSRSIALDFAILSAQPNIAAPPAAGAQETPPEVARRAPYVATPIKH